MRWVKLTLPMPVRVRYPLMTLRLTSTSLAGMLRKLVAVGTWRLRCMLAAMAAPAPRIGTPGSSVAATDGVAEAAAATVAGGAADSAARASATNSAAGFDVDGVTELTATSVGVTLAGGAGAASVTAAAGRRDRRRLVDGRDGAVGAAVVGEELLPRVADRGRVVAVALVHLVDQPRVGAERVGEPVGCVAVRRGGHDIQGNGRRNRRPGRSRAGRDHAELRPPPLRRLRPRPYDTSSTRMSTP